MEVIDVFLRGMRNLLRIFKHILIHIGLRNLLVLWKTEKEGLLQGWAEIKSRKDMLTIAKVKVNLNYEKMVAKFKNMQK